MEGGRKRRQLKEYDFVVLTLDGTAFGSRRWDGWIGGGTRVI